MEVVNLDEQPPWYRVVNYQNKGKREKRLFLCDAGNHFGRYFFKKSLPRYPLEFWSEVIAFQIAALVGVEAADVKAAQYRGEYGAVIRLFLEWHRFGELIQTNETLWEAGEYMVRLDPQFERKRGERHNLYLARKIIETLFKERADKEFWKFASFLAFDAVIGNGDRHQDNWGFLVLRDPSHSGLKYRLAPAYDNGSSLGRELSEEEIERCLNDPTRLERYIRRGKPHIKWSQDGNTIHELDHVGFLRKLLEAYPSLAEVMDRVTNFRDDRVRCMLEEITQLPITKPELRISQKRAKFIGDLLCRRRDILRREVLGSHG